jgi:hypothetical protein
MYFHPIFLIVPILIVLFLGAISFAIVGRGNRKLWILIMPVVVAVWFGIDQFVSSLIEGTPQDPLSRQLLLKALSAITLPGLLCLSAWMFRQWRESKM